MMVAALLSLVLAPIQSDSVPARPISQLVHTVFTPKNSGAPSGIRTLAQTTDHYLWVGAFGGLYRFDGVRFARYTSLDGDTLATGPINRLLPSRNGGLWIVGSGGVVYHLAEGHFTTFGKPADSVRVILLAESRSGEVMAAVSSGLFRLRDGKWEEIGPELGFPGKSCMAVWYDADDTLWAIADDRLVYLPAGSRKFLVAGHQVQAQSYGTRFTQQRDGTVWASDLSHSAYTIEKDGDGSPGFTEILDYAMAVLVDRKGSLWIGTSDHGLRHVRDVARLRGRRLKGDDPAIDTYSTKQGLLTNVVVDLLEDHEGNIWVASGGGLERFREGAFIPVPTANPGRPRYVMAGRDSSVWTSAYNIGTLERFGPRGGYDSTDPGTNSVNMTQDSSGNLFILRGSHVVRREGTRWVEIPLRRGSARRLVSEAIDTAGTFWAYSQDYGLLRLEGDTMIQVDSMTHPEHFAMLRSDRQGRIWAAQRNRVTMVAAGTVHKFGPEQGLKGQVYDFFEDSAGVVWVSTSTGLSRFEGDHFRTLDARHGIRNGMVFGAVQDQLGAWWLSTMPGILWYPPGELERVMADSAHVPRTRTFDESDGMIGGLVKSYYGYVIALSADGQVWVATDSGLARIDPRRMPPSQPPPVTIEVARLQGKEHAPADRFGIPPGSGDLEIDYTSLTYGTPERVQFRYRLEGADTAWRDVGTRRRAYYTSLAPGDYRFRVTASYGDGIWNEQPASWSFRVLPAWYQTIWFRVLLVLAIAGVGGAAVALFQRERHARAERRMREKFEATLAERVRIAQDLHDTLLQGFAGVTLQLKAAELALPDSPDLAAETILRTQDLARASLREARERVWEMKESDLDQEDLPTVLERVARERAAGTGITVSMTVHGDRRRLTRSLEDAAFRIGREAVVNAIRHAQPTRIDMTIDFTPSTLRLTVRDDGRGFTAHTAAAARSAGHFGVSGMRDRAEHLGGTCEVAAAEGGGTLVTLELGLPQGAAR
jgi:signal transduction histidine kinase/ligand-binding sensor domain-containing protein